MFYIQKKIWLMFDFKEVIDFMNIFFREMKANRKSLIIWCISMILFILLCMVKYSGISQTGQSFNDLMAGMPQALIVIFGLSTFNLAEMSGYFGVLFLYFLLIVAIHSSMLGANIISKEERDKTAEFLLTKPVSRNKIVTYKLLAAFVNILILNIVTLVSSLLIVPGYNKGASITSFIVLLMIGMFFVQLMFLFIGSGLGALAKYPKGAASAATGVLLTTYLLSMLIDLNDKLTNLKYITPFKYFEAKQILSDGKLEPVFIALSIIIITVFICLTYTFYKKRDVK